MVGSKLAASSCLSLLLVVGCGPEDSGDVESDELAPGLVIESPSEGVIAGSFADDEHALRFHSRVAEAGFDLEVEFNAMTVSARLDDEGNVHYDGYASETGEATQMTDEDRAALLALNQALEQLGTDVDPAISRLRSFTSQWSEFPSTVDLQGSVYLGFRSYSSLCSAKNTYVATTHDDWSYNDGADQTTYFAWISMDPAGPCPDGTWFWTGSAWSCTEPNHSTTIEYASGNCFGRCGGGCGSDRQLTVDCANHDSCVRFGHDVASLWCDDEFTSTLDDWASAPSCL
jgi:hypothetical protein